MTKRTLSIIYRALLVAAGAAGVLLNTLNSESIVGMLSYYTIQSNIIVIVFFAVLLALTVKNKPDGRALPLLKGMVTMCITVTFLVFHFMLRPQFFSMGDGYNQSVSNLLVHYITPLMTIGDYILFDKKGGFRWHYPFAWTAIPLLYPVYVLIYNLCGGGYTQTDGTVSPYPYFFLDIDTLGIGGVLRWVLIIFVAFVALGYVFVGIDALCGRFAKKQQLRG